MEYSRFPKGTLGWIFAFAQMRTSATSCRVTRPLISAKTKGDAFGIPFCFGGKSGIRSATITTFTCFFAYLYLTHFSLFCRYHAGVANNRFIGCLVGSLFRKKRVSFTSRLPTRSNPTINEKKFGNTLRVSEFFGGKSGIRTHDALPHT